MTIVGKEPNPDLWQVREFIDGTKVPYASLRELRGDMVKDDIAIIGSVADRMVGHDELGNTLEASEVTASEMAARTANEAYPRDRELELIARGIFDILAPDDFRFGVFDRTLVLSAAARLTRARWAVVFKLDEAEGMAPAQQTRNIENAFGMAARLRPEVIELPKKVRSLYEFLVPASVAAQRRQFMRTIPEVWYL